jgi:stress-induced morphogen
MPKNHVKPSKEELEAQEQAAIEEAERLAKEEAEGKQEEEVEPEVVEAKDDAREQADPSEEAKKRLKEKLSASARENQKIYAKNRVINKALADAEDVPEPTEQELVNEFRDWDSMSDIEKSLAKETVISRRWRQTIAQAKEQATKIEKWNESVEEFVSDPNTFITHPDLEGKADEFQEFATAESNNSVPMNILVSAFLHEKSSGKTPNKGSMFETGSGGPNEKPTPKSDKLSLEDARKLRETDYTKYKEYLNAGKIDLNV